MVLEQALASKVLEICCGWLLVTLQLHAATLSTPPTNTTPTSLPTNETRIRLYLSRTQLEQLQANLGAPQDSQNRKDPRSERVRVTRWNATELATVDIDGTQFECSVRLWGQTFNRALSRRAFLIELPEKHLWQGRRVIAVTDIGERAQAAARLFRAAGVPAPEFQTVSFALNHQPAESRVLQLLTIPQTEFEQRHPLPGWDDASTPSSLGEAIAPIDLKELTTLSEAIRSRPGSESSELRQWLSNRFNVPITLTSLAILEWIGWTDRHGAKLQLHPHDPQHWVLLPTDSLSFFTASRSPDLHSVASSGPLPPRAASVLDERALSDLLKTVFAEEYRETTRRLISASLPPGTVTSLITSPTLRYYLDERRALLMEQLKATEEPTGSTTRSGSPIFVRSSPQTDAYLAIGSNRAPRVSITIPSDHECIAFQSLIQIRAKASDPDGVVTHIEIFDGTTVISDGGLSPLEYAWDNPSVGLHHLTAVATDDQGMRSTSNPVRIHVVASKYEPVTLLSTNATFRWIRGGSRADRSWLGAAFDDGLWNRGDESRGATAPGTATNQHSGDQLFVRLPFRLEAPTSLDALTLHRRLGSNGRWFLNGQEIPTPLPGNSLALSDAPHAAVSLEHTTLVAGTNVLAVLYPSSVAEWDAELAGCTLSAQKRLLAPAILDSPHEVMANTGESVVLSAMVGGTPPFLYQWKQNGIPLAEGTNSVLQLDNLQLLDSASYSVEVRNVSGVTESDRGVLLVNHLPDLDSDGDGMPDRWEREFQLDPKDPSDANVDSDGDGQSNRNEYFCGTDPRDPLDVLHILIANTVAGFRLSLRTAGDRGYTVQYRDPVEGGAWSKFLDVPAHTIPRYVQLNDNQGPPARVYRLITPPVP